MTSQISAIQDAKRTLEESGRFLVLRKLDYVQSEFESLEDVKSPSRLLIIDTETTGLDFRSDKIIEIGMMLVDCDPATGRLGKVLETLNQFEDPGEPLSDKVKQVTGLTDEDLAGHRFDDQLITSMAARAGLVVAHNAGFDRKFLEARFPGAFECCPWACSVKDGPWDDLGVGSAKQDYLAFKVGGFFYEGHRALNDVAALAELLAGDLPGGDGQKVMRAVLGSASKPTFTLWATGAPFDIKDSLKAAGYSWCGESSKEEGTHKAWHKQGLGHEDLAAEIAFLAEIYPGGKVIIDKHTAKTRYRGVACAASKVVEIPAPLPPSNHDSAVGAPKAR